MRSSKSCILIGVLGAVLVSVAALASMGRFRPAEPRLIATAEANPSDITQHGTDWWWIEKPITGKTLLARLAGGSRETVASADEIAGYDVDGETAVWASRDGNKWSVVRRRGTANEVLWSGPERAGRPSFGSGAPLWALTSEKRASGTISLPALGPTTAICTLNADKSLRRVGRLLEPRCDVIGARDGMAYLLCRRMGFGGASVIYELSLQDGRPRRLAAEEGESQCILLPNGTLAWTAYSRDSSQRTNIACVRSLAPGGTPATRIDWLPSPGGIAAAGNSLYYVDRTINASFWRVGQANELAHPVVPPAGYLAVGLGERAALLGKALPTGPKMNIYEWPRP